MRGRALLGALALLGSDAAAAQAQDPASWCRANPERVGPCRQVRGRLTAYNGNPGYRIWIVGTHRVLGILGRSPEESEAGDMLPANVQEALGRRPFTTLVFADFEVCPLSPERAGWMRFVCVTGARGLRVERF